MLQKPVLIIGAGVVGLTLAHGLKKAGISFIIFERDTHISARDQGWAITLHWCLPFLRQLLSPPALAGLEAAQVDPELGSTNNFVFLNLATLEPKFKVPPNAERWRVNRSKLRCALLDGVAEHMHWNKRLTGIEVRDQDDSELNGQGGVVASFSDGTTFEGRLLVGAEGSDSRTREYVAPEAYSNNRLPVRLIGTTVHLTAAQVAPIRAIDPLLFQGCHPETGDFIYASILDTPASNDTKTYRLQVMMSWLAEPSIVVRKKVGVETNQNHKDETPENTERLAELKRRAEKFHPVLRDVILAISDSTEVREIIVQDWLPPHSWNNHGSRVTLAGDAAHAMTMYRGEAANHGILDAHQLCEVLKNVDSGTWTLDYAVSGYETEMRERTRTAVLLSRQACLDAHDFAVLNKNSAILKRRAL
ncbi:hypothetical protein NUW58_g1270 [Xylaria curta]|uniref:Uncharacterized protein n=1 Tax=Xylaria curta TaxID=42375 RepID=A0ACC1PNW1_9PEZI|nr:hypothetical protein NUW58_g1270 [Xylaria curta]